MSFRHHRRRRCRPHQQHHRFGLLLALSSLTSIDRTTAAPRRTARGALCVVAADGAQLQRGRTMRRGDGGGGSGLKLRARLAPMQWYYVLPSLYI